MDLDKLRRALAKFQTYPILQAKEEFPFFTRQLQFFGEGYSTPREVAKDLNHLINDLFEEPPRDAKLREEFDELAQ